MSLFKRKPKYSADDISNMIGDISLLMKHRDVAVQRSLAYKQTDKSKLYDTELEQLEANIASAQRVLGHMLTEVSDTK